MGINTGYLTAKTNKESDEVYTPVYAVKPIIKYLDGHCNKTQYTIWCPFDEEDSNYVIELRKAGYKVIATHIKNGYDFFNYEPEEKYDFIVSNPPFSLKDKVLKRLHELDCAYAMLLPLPTLQGQKRFQYLKDCEVLVFDKRINYYKNKETKEIQKGVAFASIYICKYILPESLIFEELEIE